MLHKEAVINAIILNSFWIIVDHSDGISKWIWMKIIINFIYKNSLQLSMTCYNLWHCNKKLFFNFNFLFHNNNWNFEKLLKKLYFFWSLFYSLLFKFILFSTDLWVLLFLLIYIYYILNVKYFYQIFQDGVEVI